MNKLIKRGCLATLIVLFVVLGALAVSVKYNAGATEIVLINTTGDTVTYQLSETASDWSQSGQLMPDKISRIIITPKQAGQLRVTIKGDNILLHDHLYIERGSAISYFGIIKHHGITWGIM